MPSKRESISLVACVEEDRVRLAYSHCVVRQTDLLVRDGNLVGLASGFVLGRQVPDPVRVDVERDFNLDENTRLVVSVRRRRRSLFRGKGGVAFDEFRHGIICCLQTH